MSVSIKELRDYWNTCARDLSVSASVRLGVSDDSPLLVSGVRAPAAVSPSWAVDSGGVPWSESALAVLMASEANGMPCAVHAVGHDLSVCVPSVGLVGYVMTGFMQTVLNPARGWPNGWDPSQRVVYLCADVCTYVATVERLYKKDRLSPAAVWVGDDLAVLDGVPDGSMLLCAVGGNVAASNALQARVRLYAAARLRSRLLRLFDVPPKNPRGWN